MVTEEHLKITCTLDLVSLQGNKLTCVKNVMTSSGLKLNGQNRKDASHHQSEDGFVLSALRSRYFWSKKGLQL